MKIGQQLPNIFTKVKWHVFLAHPVEYDGSWCNAITGSIIDIRYGLKHILASFFLFGNSLQCTVYVYMLSSTYSCFNFSPLS